MTRRQLRIGTALVLVAAAGWLAGCQIRFERRTEAQAHALPAEAGDVLQELARPSALEGAPLAGGYRWTGLAVQRYEARFVLSDGAGEVVVRLGHPSASVEGARTRDCGVVRLGLPAAAAPGGAAAGVLADRICANAGGIAADALWRPVFTGGGAPPAWTPAGAGDGAAAADGALPTVTLSRAAWMRALQAGWVLLLALLVALAVRAAARAPRPAPAARMQTVAALALLLAAAIALRAALATWGPGDTWMNLRRAFVPPGADLEYGSAPNALLRLLFGGAPPHHDAVVVVAMILGGLAPLALYALARALGGPRSLALVAALLLALQPLLVRHGGEANRQPYVLLLALVALWGLVRYLRGAGLLHLVVWTLAAALCARSRPEGVLVVPLGGLLLLVADRPRALLRRPLVLRGLAVLATGAAVAALWLALSDPERAAARDLSQLLPSTWFPFDPDRCVWLDPQVSSPLVAALALTGIAAGLVRRRRVALWWLATLLLVGYAASALPRTSGDVLSARYQTLALVAVAWAAAGAIHELGRLAAARRGPRAGWAVLVVACVAVVAASVGPLLRVTTPRTIDLEYRFLLEEAARLPDGARVRLVTGAPESGIKYPTYIPSVIGADQRWEAWTGELPAGDGPAFYYRVSGCAATNSPALALERCRDAQRRFGAAPVVERTLPARPMGTAAYDTDTLTVGFYRMTE